MKKMIQSFLDQSFEYAKAAFAFLVTLMITACAPIIDVLYILMATFLFNIVAGIISDVNINKQPFSLKKAFEALKQMCFFGLLVFFIFNVGDRLHNAVIMDTGVKWITIIVVYFYLTNILRNATIIFPKNKAIYFLYILLTTQIFAELKRYLGIKNDSKINDYENSN